MAYGSFEKSLDRYITGNWGEDSVEPEEIEICKHWKDYCEPDIGLCEWCKKLQKPCYESGGDKNCPHFEKDENVIVVDAREGKK